MWEMHANYSHPNRIPGFKTIQTRMGDGGVWTVRYSLRYLKSFKDVGGARNIRRISSTCRNKWNEITKKNNSSMYHTSWCLYTVENHVMELAMNMMDALYGFSDNTGRFCLLTKYIIWSLLEESHHGNTKWLNLLTIVFHF